MGSFPLLLSASILCLLTALLASAAERTSEITAGASMDGPTQNPNPAFGHNVTATSYTLPKGHASVGNYFLAYGLTDEWMIATSPWLAINYNMPMIGLKFSSADSLVSSRLSLEVAYLKTYDYGLDWYHQESWLNRLTLTYVINPSYRVHVGFGFQYFLEDRAPFSLRPPSLTKTPVTTSLSALQEIQLTQSTGMFIESGILGANYPNPYGHLGLSGFIRWSNAFLQLGASTSIPLGGSATAQDTGYWKKPWKNIYGEYHSSIYFSNPVAVHPEIQLQLSI